MFVLVVDGPDRCEVSVYGCREDAENALIEQYGIDPGEAGSVGWAITGCAPGVRGVELKFVRA